MIDFTIVTASYNYGHHIGECLDSVVSQEGVEVEHLVMDAGSTDDTREVVERYPHATFFQEADKGMSDGINKGFRRAQGRWVMWLNADDRLRPGALAEVKRFAEANSDADVIFGGWNFVDGDGAFIRRMTLFPFSPRILANHGCYIASTSTFYRRETTIGEGQLLNINFACVMDGEYFCRLMRAGKRFRYLPVVLADFRLHDESISQRNLRSEDIEGILARQKQLAESTTIRRIYGWVLFKDEMLNSVVEGILYHVFRVQKGLLRWLHCRSCREPKV
ncbi:MAG: glycosyltransferase family 2 protein [Verrucomicrobia bacterium]|nr:glycosyltransferase family 2 protein [Verrucomicrobiota bacterium]